MKNKEIAFCKIMEISPETLRRGDEILKRLKRQLTESVIEVALDYADGSPNFNITIETSETSDGGNRSPLIVKQTAVLHILEKRGYRATYLVDKNA